MQPPRLPGQLLVRSGELFGISEGTTRVALSRMVAAGELEAEDGIYQLAGPLLDRQDRQTASRRPHIRDWNGSWIIAVVTADRRDAAERNALREAMRRLKLAEMREGVWLRPDNLDPDRAPEPSSLVAEQCRTFVGRPADQGVAGDDESDDAALALLLWDLGGWALQAEALRSEMLELVASLDAGDTTQLAPAFVLSAAVLRHMLSDPLLPDPLLPSPWPGAALRKDYERYDAAFKAVWRDWFRSQARDA